MSSRIEHSYHRFLCKNSGRIVSEKEFKISFYDLFLSFGRGHALLGLKFKNILSIIDSANKKFNSDFRCSATIHFLRWLFAAAIKNFPNDQTVRQKKKCKLKLQYNSKGREKQYNHISA